MTIVMIHTEQYMTTVITPQAPHEWPTEPTVREATEFDAQVLLRMVDRCSRNSLFHRFHGYSDRSLYGRVLVEHLGDGGSLIACRYGDCIGLATVALGGPTVDLGLLVEDAWQRRGVGTGLLAAAATLARANGAVALHADVLGDDAFIVGLLRRVGPLEARINSGTYSIDVDLTRPPAAGPR
jgi:GNAT superfamily N-acetyltransferase